MASGDADSESATPNRLAGTIIAILGLLLVVAHSPLFVQVRGISVLVLAVLLPSTLGLVLVAVGYGTAREELVAPADAWPLTLWVVAGMVVFLLVGVWIVVLDVLLGERVPFGYLISVNAVTLGGVVGAVIGLYDAQSREYTRALERRGEHLERKNKRLDDFVSFVSHDLRNPLSVAEGRLALASEDCESEHLEHVERAHERMNVLIDNLLELARQTESKTDVEPVKLQVIVDNAWRNVDTHNADLDVGATTVLSADRSQFQQLFENLFRNAVEYGGEAVSITVGELPDGTGIFVEDDGPGIPEAERDRVFERGFSGNSEGIGFGLAIVNAVVQAHDWAIRVTEGRDGGARFEITGMDIEG